MMKLTKITLIIFSLFAVSFSNAQEGLVAHWSFDSLTNNQFIDHVTNQLGGTAYGCQSVSGPVGKALDFDGDDYARVPGNNSPPPAVLADLSEGSISVWFRVDNIPEYGIRPIFYYGKNDGCDFFDAANEGLIIEVGHSPVHDGSRRMYFTMWTNGCSFPSFCYDSWNAIIEGEWYHYVAIVGSDYNTGYLNGELMADRKYNFGTPRSHLFFSDALAHENLWIGRGYWDSTNMFFDGAIDEIKIFDRPLNETEVNQLFQEGNLTSVQEDIWLKTEVFIYPNPAIKKIHLNIPYQLAQPLSFVVYNNAGAIVYQTKITEDNKANTVDLSRLPKGFYIYALQQRSNVILNSGELIMQ